MAKLIRIICALTALPCLFFCTLASAQGPPNIIVIVADDAGYADWGFQNGVEGSNPTPTDIPTPNLDALAGRGVRFSRAQVAANCQPTRAALVTGGYQNRIGNENVGNNYTSVNQGFASRGVAEGLPSSVETIWERVGAQGYSTAAVGKWHLGSIEDVPGVVQGNRPEHQGVDEFFGFWGGSRNYTLGTDNSQANRLRRTVVNTDGSVTDTNEEFTYQGQYITNVLSDFAIDYIDRQAADNQPFFLYQSYSTPHTPLQNSPDFNDPLLANFPTSTAAERGRRQYASSLLTLDKDVGRILDRLEDPDGDGDSSDSIADNTLVVFINDNGGAEVGGGAVNFSDNGVLRGRKGNSFEGGLRVPLIVAGAGVDPSVHGTTYSNIVHGIDILPTALAAAGGATLTPENDGVDGVDLLPFINGENTGAAHDVLVHRWRGRFAVTRQDWKLVKDSNSPTNQNIQLFNIANDVSETNDLAAANPEIVASLLRDLTDHEAVFDKPRHEILGSTSEETINIFDHFTFRPEAPTGSTGGTTIIGENGSIGNPSSGNGNFEGVGATSGSNNVATFSEVPNWFNLQGNENPSAFTSTQGTDGSPEPGSRAGFFSVNQNTGVSTVGNDTSYTITEAGETFDISFALHQFGGAAGYNGDEVVNVNLVTSENGINSSTTANDLTILGSVAFPVSGTWTDEMAEAFYTSTADDIGKTVFLSLEFDRGTNPANINGPFPRIDLVELTTSGGGGSTGGLSITNWSANGAWFEGGTTTVETLLHSDAFPGAILEFPTVDDFSYVSNNDLVRMTGQTFILNQIILSGNFNGASNQSATIQGNELLFTNDLDGVAPQIAIEASNAGASDFNYEIDLDVVLYNDLTITGDGDVTVSINGEISDFFEARGLIKSGTSTAVLTANNTYSGDTVVEDGTLSITNAFLEDTADVYLALGSIFDLDFDGTDIIDSLFIDGIAQETGTWGAIGSGADNESALLSGSGLLSVSTTVVTLNGDFDGDGDVDGADFLAWQRVDGTPAGLDAWRDNYGNDSLSAIANSQNVPEPSCLALLAAVGCLAGCTRQRVAEG